MKIYEKSYNLFDLSNTQSQKINGIDFIIDSQNGTVTLNGTATLNQDTAINLTINPLLNGDFYVSGCPDGGSFQTYDIFVWDDTLKARVKQWDGVAGMESVLNASQSNQIKLIQGHVNQIRIRARYGMQFDNMVFVPMIRIPTAPATFEPYGDIWHDTAPKLYINGGFVDKSDLPKKYTNGSWQNQ